MTTATVTVLRGGGDFLACGSSAPAASGSLRPAVAVPEEAKGTSFSPKQLTAATMVSMVTSRVMGAASLGVEAWLVSVS